jgi:hypothetical protein
MDDADFEIQSGAKAASAGLCPYCHVGLKAATVTRCSACGAGHHPECWAENGGCAILGCSLRATPARPPVSPPPAAAEAAAQHGAGRGNPSTIGVAAAVIVAVAVAVAAAAVVVLSDSDDVAGTVTTVTVAPEVLTTTVQGAPSPTPVVEQQTGATPTTTAATATTPTSAGRLVAGSRYAVRIPAGWRTEASGEYHRATRATENSYTESRWRSPEDVNTYIHIDYTTGFEGSVADAAKGVRSDYRKSADFRERSFGPITLDDGRELWRWRYAREEDGVFVEKVDYFLSGCDTGFALLGVAPAPRWPQMARTYARVAGSLQPRC